METRFLLPNRCKLIGCILLIPSTILGFSVIFFEFKLKFLEMKVFTLYSGGVAPWDPGSRLSFESNNVTGTIVGIMFLIGALMVVLSKEKNEDEFISKTRLESLLWATIINYIILFFCFLFIYGLGFMYVMILNMFTILILFIIRFNYIIYRSSKSLRYEK
jgi:hypothetical protein